MSTETSSITSKYLFGERGAPSNFVDESIIRASSIKYESTFTTPAATYMTTGGGRFVTPLHFDLVQDFFDLVISGRIKGQSGVDVTYTKSQAVYEIVKAQNFIDPKDEKDAIDKYGVLYTDIKQSTYRDSINDENDRIYIYETGAFKLGDSTAFVINANGAPQLRNWSIVPIEFRDEIAIDNKDNFDFTGGNNITPDPKGQIDPSGIGRTVDISFSGQAPVSATYDMAAFNADVAKVQGWSILSGLERISKLATVFESVSNELWTQGITKFLDNDNGRLSALESRVVLYAEQKGSVVDPNSTFLAFDKLGAYIKNGVTVVASSGLDAMYGTEANDVFYSGAGNDVIDGRAGVDAIGYLNVGPVAITASVDASGSTLISGDGGTDIVRNVEVVKLTGANDLVRVDTNAVAAAGFGIAFDGGNGNDTLSVSGRTEGGIVLIGGDGADTFIVDRAFQSPYNWQQSEKPSATIIYGGTGADTIRLEASAKVVFLQVEGLSAQADIERALGSLDFSKLASLNHAPGSDGRWIEDGPLVHCQSRSLRQALFQW
jgi:RTX calcium-binding nonapeptide repeat (4 copies)